MAKLGTVEEEADESSFWLEFIQVLRARCALDRDCGLCVELERLHDEATQLLAITIASRKTARAAGATTADT